MINYKPPKILEYGEYIRQLYPEIFKDLPVEAIKTITFQITEDCCLQCSYCYQIHNKNFNMTFETIKPFLDKLLNNKFENITTFNTKGIVWEFIGGEPFLQIDLISQITDYLFENMALLNHPWALYSRISISSNGLLYFNEKVQEFLVKYDNILSLGISIDGNKELHDSCRIDLNGHGSYDRAIAAVRHYKIHYGKMPTIKMTFAPANISYLYEAYLSVIQEGYIGLMGNCVYEEGWTEKDATILYQELKKVADYIIDNDLYNKIYISFFEEDFFKPLPESQNDNWCGGVGCHMLAIDYKGDFYHCIRYMNSSLQDEQEPLVIGNIEYGIGQLPQHKKNWESTLNITRRSQSTDECFYCPIGAGCSWCSAYNYQKTGSVNKRVTYICIMHKARALANVYYWNKLFNKLNMENRFKNYLPDSESLKIISKEELDLLKALERR